MNKTPKKAAPGGDERNLYNRRLKATTAASKASETSSHKRQCESESSNRFLLNPIQKGITHRKKTLKTKLRVQTAKVEASKPVKQLGRPPATAREKKLLLAIKNMQDKPENMQPESEESEVKLNVSIQEEKIHEDSSNDKQESVEGHVDHALPDETSVSEECKDSANKDSASKEEKSEDQCLDEANNSVESKEVEENEENDIMLSFEVDDSPGKGSQSNVNDKDSKDESKEQYHSITVESTSGVQSKGEVQNESQTDTENNPEDVFESTMSELSEVSETTSQNDTEKEAKKSDEATGKDVSFVNYDPSIMLKDVQIKLNDCLKENSKLFETSNAENSSSPIPPPKDMSFGKTLRSISGRRSISRMRHVTLREQRYSPNNSMFVNTSSVSLPMDDTSDFKILRYSTGLSDTVSATNGNPTERKRKYETEDWNSLKKQKTDTENSLLNTSISLLKGLRRPIQISTPVSELKFQSDKLDLSEDESSPVNESSRKWCVIM